MKDSEEARLIKLEVRITKVEEILAGIMRLLIDTDKKFLTSMDD